MIPAIRRYFAEMRYIPKPFLRQGVVLPDLDRRASFVGRLLPAAAIRQASRIQILDDFIGAGWALVGIDFDNALARIPDSAFWRDLNASSIVLYPRGSRMNFVPIDDSLDAVFRIHRGEWLIVRPDRIVAAAVSADGLSTIERDLANQLSFRAETEAPLLESEITTPSTKQADVWVDVVSTAMKFQ